MLKNQIENVTDVQVFNNTKFGEVRTVEIDGKIFFVGKDVARALGYKEPHKAISRHCRGGMIHPISDNHGITRDTNIIPEGDLYRLAAKSELEGADEFESWIFDEVLPAIRKTGGYILSHADDTPDMIMARALIVAKDTIDRVQAEKDRLLLTAQEQERQLKEAAPKVEYHDRCLESKSKVSVNSIALCLGISHIKLNKLISEWGVQYSQSGVYYLTAKYRNRGLAKHFPYPYLDSAGTPQTKQHLYWTEEGKKFIVEMYELNCITKESA